MDYLPRIADKILKERLDLFGAVLIEGPKWCGKTTTGSQQAKSIIRLQDPDTRAAYLATAMSHLMVITGGPIAYTRPDGVHVVPLACLKD